ncbi:hypothetical protein NDU88_002857 [Pleurodeles waltl]|uniref:Uncharacterized protein n=1 Tax=Pleurodeles waltl TaxID=8319 RepID=A0AAV7Q8A8_PLEWA|nr:hypothetical protein NDU88_002857 [Pleurodeles waltl]
MLSVRPVGDGELEALEDVLTRGLTLTDPSRAQATNFQSSRRRGKSARIGPTRRRDETEEDRGNLRSRGVVVRCSRTREERRSDGASRKQNGGRSERITATGEAAAVGGDRPEGEKPKTAHWSDDAGQAGGEKGDPRLLMPRAQLTGA